METSRDPFILSDFPNYTVVLALSSFINLSVVEVFIIFPVFLTIFVKLSVLYRSICPLFAGGWWLVGGLNHSAFLSSFKSLSFLPKLK